MKNKEKTDIFDRIWSFLASVKLAVVILIILAITSIVGTIIPQNDTQAMQFLTEIVGDNTAPTVYNIIIKFDFINMYHSWWFVSLLVLFSINIVVCSLERLPKTLRLIKTPLKPLAENVIKTLPVTKDFTIETSLNIAKDEILNSLTASKYRVFEATEGDAVQLYSQKGRYTRLGVYIVHLSILLMFVGAIIGSQFGFKGSLNLPEGGTSDVIYTTGGKPIPLGFTIKCNWYNTEYYADSDTPREYQSELVIIDGGREVLKKKIEVNSPLKYKGITFYQASYGMIPDAVGEFDLNVISKGRQKSALHLRLGESFEIPDTDIKGTIVDFSPALGRNPQSGELFTYAETMINPAVKIKFNKTGSDEFAENEWNFTGWILKRIPETGILPEGHRIEFKDYWGVEYTGLQVSRDPGVGIIYFASIIMTLGLYIAFFMSHKKIWIRLAPETSGEKSYVRISTGGSVNKNRLAIEREIEGILSKASQAIERKHSLKKA